MDIKDRRILDKLKLEQTQDVDLHLRRITNAAPSVNANDYVIRSEMLDLGAGGLGPGLETALAKFDSTSSIDSSFFFQDSNKIFKHSAGLTSPVPDVQTLSRGISLLHNGTRNGNEWPLAVMLDVPVTNSTTSYQKNAGFFWAQTLDPSDYNAPAKERDVVGLDTRGTIKATNTSGRAWGAFIEASCAGNGFLVAAEFACSNGGSDQPNIDTTTTKVAIAINPGVSSVAPTAAMIIADSVGASATYHHGIVVKQAACTDDVFAIVKTGSSTLYNFCVKPTGQTLIGDLPNGATTGNYNPAIYGSATIRTNFTLVDSSNNKNLLLFFTDTGTSRHRISAGHYDTPASTWPITIEINAVPAVTINVDGATLFALASSPVTIAQGNILVKNYIFIADATSGAHVATLATDAGSSSVIIGSSATGGATVYPIAFQIETDVWMKLFADGGLEFKGGTGAVSAASKGRIRFNSGTNKFEISENGAAYATISTGGGGGSVGGSGTIGKIPLWQTTTDLTDSALTEAVGTITTTKAIVPSTDNGIDLGTSILNWNEFFVVSIKSNVTGTALRLLNLGPNPVILGVNGGDVWQVTSSGHFEPVTNNTYNIGHASFAPSVVYGVNFNVTSGNVTFSTSGRGLIFSTTSLALVAAGLEFYQSSTLRMTVHSAGITVVGTCTATTFSGSGASLTSVPASSLTGTIADGRLSTNVPLKNTANTFTATITLSSVNVIVSNGFGIGTSSGNSLACASGGLEFYVGGVLKGTISSSGTTLIIDGVVRTLHNTGGTCTLT